MSDKLIQFDDYKPYASGPCKCGYCNHKWFGVIALPLDKDMGYECPSCRRFYGFLEYPISYRQGESNYICNCGSAFFSVQCDGVTCGICGTKHLNVLEKIKE